MGQNPRRRDGARTESQGLCLNPCLGPPNQGSAERICHPHPLRVFRWVSVEGVGTMTTKCRSCHLGCIASISPRRYFYLLQFICFGGISLWKFEKRNLKKNLYHRQQQESYRVTLVPLSSAEPFTGWPGGVRPGALHRC